MIKKLAASVSTAVAVALSASAEFSMSEDFTVADARGGAYGIVPLCDTALSHRHGWVEDGVYRIPVEGNRHVIAAPRLRDFRLEADYSLVEFKRLDLTMGFKVFFRHDIATKRGHELAVFFDHDWRLHFELSDEGDCGAPGGRAPPRELRVVQRAKGMKLDDLHLVLTVSGTKGTVETLGETVAFMLPADGATDGKVAIDQTQNEGVKLILKKLSLTSPDVLPTTPVGRWRFTLPQSQGSVAAPVYDVTADRYASGEVAVRAALSGCLAGRAPRQDTGGSAWSSLGERITAPYVKFTLPGGDEKTLYLWNGRRHFRDPFRRKTALPCAWPCERTFVLEALPKEFLVAAGYEKFMTHPHRFAANGPYEQVRTQADEVVHTGEALGPDRVAFAAASPADKKIVSKIPADLPLREKALKHAREQHYFFESEKPRFTLTTVCRTNDFAQGELVVAPWLETVYGDAVGIAVEKTGERRDPLPGGYERVAREFVCTANPDVGVWHLETRIGAEPAVRTERTVFEVLPDDPNGPCPPLASGLPELLSIPNEIKFLEESAFDPWSDLGGVSHYYSIDLRYPAIAEKLHSWEGDHLYRRKCLVDGGGRNASNVLQKCEENRAHMRWADYYNCLPDESHREGRFDFAQARTYVGEQFKILKDWLEARHYTLKALPPEEIAKRGTDAASVAGNRGIPDAALEEVFNLGWDDFKAFARPRVAAYIRAFDDYLLSVNPKIARATYGPFPIYVAANKTPYCLDYAGYPLDVDPRLMANGSFWIFEDYHYSCDYPLYRPAFFAAAYKLLYPNSRRLFPEIYYEGWGRCSDGAVYQAHPDKYPKLAYSHQRRIAYQYGFGTPFLRDDGTFGYWTDDGFHARNPEREAMDEFVYAWGNLVKNRPAKPLKSPYVIVDLDAFRRFGDRFEKGGAFNLDSPTLKDVRSDIVNLAEASVAYAYERCCAAGYATPVTMTLKALDHLTPETCEFAILPPLVKSTPSEVLAAVERAIARGVKFIGFIEAAGLEKRLAAFYPKAPTLAGRDTFASRFERGREAVDPQTAAEVTALFAQVAPAPAVRATRGTVLACESKSGDAIVVLSDESPLYGDTAAYPATFRFTVSRPGIGKAAISADAPYAVVSRSDDRLEIRTQTGKDTALFFRFARPRKVRVACIGDSITWGYAMTNRVAECYPAQLQRMLGDGYEVLNCGDSGSGVYLAPKVPAGKWCPHSWRKGAAAARAYAFKPDIVVSNLGINDSGPFMGELGAEGSIPIEKGLFRRQYIDLLSGFGRGARAPKFIVWTRLGPTGKGHSLKGKPNAALMEEDLKAVAAAVHATTLDMLTPLEPLVETAHFAADGIHPEGGAQRVIAETTARAIRQTEK